MFCPLHGIKLVADEITNDTDKFYMSRYICGDQKTHTVFVEVRGGKNEPNIIIIVDKS